jgi:hypothetical protein
MSLGRGWVSHAGVPEGPDGWWWRRLPVDGPVWEALLQRGWQVPATSLAPSDEATIGRFLRAAAYGPTRAYFRDWEFHTLFGLTRPEVAEVARAWPKRSLESAAAAFDGSLGHLWGYPHGLEKEMVAELAIDTSEDLRDLCDCWRWVVHSKAGASGSG